MFAIIKLQQKWCFKPIKLETLEQGDAKFYIVSVRNRDTINWQKIERMLGDTRSRVILSDGIKIPHTACVKKATCDRYIHKLTAAALEEILHCNAKFVKDKLCTLIDIQCKHQNYADILVKYFNRVKIITNKVEFYNNYRDAKLYECGAAVTITTECLHYNDDSSLFVSPEGIILPLMENIAAPIIAAGRLDYAVKAPVYHSFYERDIPALSTHFSEDALANHEFVSDIAGALYEFCGVRSIGTSANMAYFNDDLQTIDYIKTNIFLPQAVQSNI